MSEFIRPKDACIKYGIGYAALMELLHSNKIKHEKRKMGTQRSRFFIDPKDLDFKMRSFGYCAKNTLDAISEKTQKPCEKNKITNESPKEIIIDYIEGNLRILRNKGIKPLKNILNSIQRSESYKTYPSSLREGIVFLLEGCFQFEEAANRGIDFFIYDEEDKK